VGAWPPAETVRVFVELPEEPPQLTPAAARTLLSILQKAVVKQKREAEADHQARRADLD